MERHTTAWLIAGVLLVLLIGMTYLWMTAREELATVLTEGRESLEEARDDIRMKCSGPGILNNEACQSSLKELSAILQEFSERIQNAATTTATTTSAN